MKQSHDSLTLRVPRTLQEATQGRLDWADPAVVDAILAPPEARREPRRVPSYDKALYVVAVLSAIALVLWS